MELHVHWRFGAAYEVLRPFGGPKAAGSDSSWAMEGRSVEYGMPKISWQSTASLFVASSVMYDRCAEFL